MQSKNLSDDVALTFSFFFFHFSISFVNWPLINLTGEVDDTNIKSLRSRQMKNFHLALMISQVNALERNSMYHLLVLSYSLFNLLK
jgi:hypothetical protein